jgi:hypothetical protein
LLQDVALAGPHELFWDVRDGHGNRVAAGTYFLQLKVGGQVATEKVLVVGRPE